MGIDFCNLKSGGSFYCFAVRSACVHMGEVGAEQ